MWSGLGNELFDVLWWDAVIMDHSSDDSHTLPEFRLLCCGMGKLRWPSSFMP